MAGLGGGELGLLVLQALAGVGDVAVQPPGGLQVAQALGLAALLAGQGGGIGGGAGGAEGGQGGCQLAVLLAGGGAGFAGLGFGGLQRRQLGLGGGVAGLQVCDVAVQAAGLLQQGLPARPALGQRGPVGVLIQPLLALRQLGAGIGLLLVGGGQGLGGGLLGLGGAGLGLGTVLELGAEHGQAGVQLAGLGKRGLGSTELLVGLLAGSVCGLQGGGGAGFAGLCSLAGGAGLLPQPVGAGHFGGQALGLRPQRAGGLHGLQQGQVPVAGPGGFFGLHAGVPGVLGGLHLGVQLLVAGVPAQVGLQAVFLAGQVVQHGSLRILLGVVRGTGLGRQGAKGIQPGLQAVQHLALGLHALEGPLRQGAEGVGAGQGLQQLGALVVAGLEEGGKVVLRQQHSAGELVKIQADAAFDAAQRVGLGVVVQRHQVGQAVQADVAGLQPPVGART